MGQEIERKFLVRQLPNVDSLDGDPIVQGYLRADAEGSVRVRITGTGARLTVKGPTRGHRRLELEYPIPPEDARQMLDALTVGSLIEKVRYRIEHEGFTWELDVFSGGNQGLVLAEVELAAVDDEPPLPPWLGAEVSEDARFFNASLARVPFSHWPAAVRDHAESGEVAET
ncbi:MAG: CYTH domain-containing protein [Pseudomonadales bacterium]